MKASKSLLALGFALACAAITFSLAVCAQAQTITYLAPQNIIAPRSPSLFVQGTDGNFYSSGDSAVHPNGYIYRMTPTGAITILYSFCAHIHCSDGDQPLAPILGSDGNLYGVTTAGGNSTASGTVYKLTLGGELTTLYSFCPSSGCADGQYPLGIIQASDGNLYGTTQFGGGTLTDVRARFSRSAQAASSSSCTPFARRQIARMAGNRLLRQSRAATETSTESHNLAEPGPEPWASPTS